MFFIVFTPVLQLLPDPLPYPPNFLPFEKKTFTEFNLCSWMCGLSFEHGQPTREYTLELTPSLPAAANCQRGRILCPPPRPVLGACKGLVHDVSTTLGS